MKIRAEKKIIESILINLQTFIEKKNESQITSNILFTTQKRKLDNQSSGAASLTTTTPT